MFEAPARAGPTTIAAASSRSRYRALLIAAGYPDGTIRLCLIKVAGRVTEMVTRIKIALPTAYPYKIGFAMLAGQIAKLPP